MIATAFLLALIPEHKKHYNKLTLCGAILFFISFVVAGPINFFEPSRQEGIHWIAAGIAIIGIAEAFIMLHSMSALEESLSGAYPLSKIGEVSNAMGSLISAAVGAGNASGIIFGALFFYLFSTKNCLELPSSDF